jgi:ribonuclease HII
MAKSPHVLSQTYRPHALEAGVDEAGRGCLAGPVVAAAVILPPSVDLPGLTDSKQLGHQARLTLRPLIIEQSLAWAVGMISAQRIDEINILNATYEAMHEAIASLHLPPECLAIDGNRFRPYPHLPHACLVRGDSRFLNIAAASVLAKTYRDELMLMLHESYPAYHWASNKGYPTRAHKLAIQAHGPSPYHRRSFRWGLNRTLFETEQD